MIYIRVLSADVIARRRNIPPNQESAAPAGCQGTAAIIIPTPTTKEKAEHPPVLLIFVSVSRARPAVGVSASPAYNSAFIFYA